MVPTTMEEYCMKPKSARGAGHGPAHDNIELDEFYDDDGYDLDDDDDDDDDFQDDDEDSGNGES